MTPPPIRIGDRLVGQGAPAFLVAELSGNHNGDLHRALETIHAAAESGADAIKLQTYTPDALTIDCDRPDFTVPGDGAWSGRTLYSLYQEAHTPLGWHERLFAEARSCGLIIFSTPFDGSAVDLLTALDAPAFKIASFEMTDDALLRRVAATGRPLIVSTGMATLEEIGHALGVLRGAGANDLILLHCTSSYPAPDASMRLATISALRAITGCSVGLSDHSHGHTAAVAAVVLGACMVEKHFTIRRTDGGVDSHFSLEPPEFATLVREVRRVEAMIGVPELGPGMADAGSLVFRRSLYVTADVAAGAELTAENVRSIRPGYGMAPRYLDLVLGRRPKRPIPRGTPLTWNLLLD